MNNIKLPGFVLNKEMETARLFGCLDLVGIGDTWKHPKDYIFALDKTCCLKVFLGCFMVRWVCKGCRQDY